MVECLKKPLGKSVGLRGIVFWGQIFIFYIKKQTVLFGGGESFLADQFKVLAKGDLRLVNGYVILMGHRGGDGSFEK
jgi:hypothetical protein